MKPNWSSLAGLAQNISTLQLFSFLCIFIDLKGYSFQTPGVSVTILTTY